MNWEEYRKNPAINADGYWTDVPYWPSPLSEYHPTKGFISKDGFRIAAMGHVWFPDQRSPEYHYFTFNSDAKISHEIHSNRIIFNHADTSIKAALSDKLVYLATSFREKYADNFAESLDRCVQEVLRLTEKRK